MVYDHVSPLLIELLRTRVRTERPVTELTVQECPTRFRLRYFLILSALAGGLVRIATQKHCTLRIVSVSLRWLFSPSVHHFLRSNNCTDLSVIFVKGNLRHLRKASCVHSTHGSGNAQSFRIIEGHVETIAAVAISIVVVFVTLKEKKLLPESFFRARVSEDNIVERRRMGAYRSRSKNHTNCRDRVPTKT
ncbi:uncharacterized protein LOC111260237 [Varroa jacobsoni]|uniref:uncharacterized protein LOC111260237 n=1 Tax=Varroa jacobsoni TaxID=62625 RepID=UPI000BF9A741|nr:uncharacterized protein LOC111260237 [Varroa jacobsoni]